MSSLLDTFGRAQQTTVERRLQAFAVWWDRAWIDTTQVAVVTWFVSPDVDFLGDYAPWHPSCTAREVLAVSVVTVYVVFGSAAGYEILLSRESTLGNGLVRDG